MPSELNFPHLQNAHNNVICFTGVNNSPEKGSERSACPGRHGTPAAHEQPPAPAGTQGQERSGRRLSLKASEARSSALSCSHLAPAPTPNGGHVSALTVTLLCLTPGKPPGYERRPGAFCERRLLQVRSGDEDRR